MCGPLECRPLSHFAAAAIVIISGSDGGFLCRVDVLIIIRVICTVTLAQVAGGVRFSSTAMWLHIGAPPSIDSNAYVVLSAPDTLNG